ncbi:MAG: menaquinone biosynthesis protein [Thermoleophilia bacterium]|nr:menaquinone biosynthesis protein [Thermoleophilia bacterium]
MGLGDMRVRVGHIRFLNCYPLYYGLKQLGLLAPGCSGAPEVAVRETGTGSNDREFEFELVPGVPTELNSMLASGLLDISPVSSIAYATNDRDLLLSERLSISSAGAVDSIQLVTKKQSLGSVHKVALTRQSATSVVLLKIIFKLRYAHDVSYGELTGPVERALEEYDAVLLIGDQGLEALHFPISGTRSYDLGELWYEWTGLPMVYAVWAARADFAQSHPEELHAVDGRLNQAMNYGRAHLPEAAKAALASYRFTEQQVFRFFSRLRYEFSPEYRKGLSLFYELAYEAGELSQVPQLKFIPPSSPRQVA